MEKRFYIDKEKINGDEVLIEDEEYTHLYKVLRFKEGDNIECFYDNSLIYNCVIASMDKKCALAKIQSTTPCEVNPNVNLTVFQGVPKGDKLELITQKLCELGVSEISPFTSKYCMVKARPKKSDRLNKIAISACKQCGRTQILKVNAPLTFEQMLTKLRGFDQVIFANETEKTTTLQQVASGKKIALIVGCEGGFSTAEIAKIIDIGGVSISLGKRILRAETASIVGSALVLHHLGEI